MTSSFRSQLSQLFREIEIDLGTTELGALTLESLKAAVRDLKGQDLHHFFLQLLELTEDIHQTEPRFATLIDAFHEVLEVAYDEEIHHPQANYPLKKKKFMKRLDQIIERKKGELTQLLKQTRSLKVAGKGILVFDHSRTVQAALAALHRQGQHFSVIVAEQDTEKTESVIEALHRNGIPFRVVPSHTVVHLADCIDLVFLGGVTLKSTMDFVMDPGANAIVSQFHLLNKKIYAFLATTKFSLWESEKRTEIYSHTHQRKHHCKPIEFERVKFSHDRVPIHWFERIVTEQGIWTPRQTETFYTKKLKERLAADEKFRADLRRNTAIK